LPIIDPETLEFEINVDNKVSTGGLGGPAILPMSLANMARMSQAFPNKAFSGSAAFRISISAVVLHARLRHVQVCTAAMLDSAIGPKHHQETECGTTLPRSTPTNGRRSRTSADRAAIVSCCNRRFVVQRVTRMPVEWSLWRLCNRLALRMSFRAPCARNPLSDADQGR